VREKIGNETVELYGIKDLNAEMKFQHIWVILCEDKIAIFEEKDLVGRNILISKIVKVRERNSLSSTTYDFLETKIKGHDHQNFKRRDHFG
jgi:hypothetical protein